MTFSPDKEGVDHINIYSKSKLYLGRFMSNFFKWGFVHDGKNFGSIEHWWYYQLTNHPVCLDSSRAAYEVKKEMQEWIKENGVKGDIDRNILKQLLKAKLMGYSKGVLLHFLLNDLPFTHYYVYSGRVVQAREQFLVEIWEEIRKEMREELKSIYNAGFISHSNLNLWEDATYKEFNKNSNRRDKPPAIEYKEVVERTMRHKVTVAIEEAL